MRPKLSIRLRGDDKENFLNLVDVILSSPSDDENPNYYNIPETSFGVSGLDLTNQLLLGLSEVVVSEKGTFKLIDDVQYILGDSVELWVNALALEACKKYITAAERLKKRS